MSDLKDSGAASKRSFTVKQVAILAVAVAAVVALLPIGATAAGTAVMRIVDGNGTSKVEVDAGKLRVGDGAGALSVDGNVKVSDAAGPLTVDGTTSQPAARILATGNCHDGSGGPIVVDIPNTAGRRIVGVHLGAYGTHVEGQVTGNASADARLALIAPGDTHPFANLMVTRAPGYDENSRQLDFGPGISDPDAGNWNIRCSTTTASTASGWGRWVVWGY
jgi:hypothetical protein